MHEVPQVWYERGVIFPIKTLEDYEGQLDSWQYHPSYVGLDWIGLDIVSLEHHGIGVGILIKQSIQAYKSDVCDLVSFIQCLNQFISHT